MNKEKRNKLLKIGKNHKRFFTNKLNNNVIFFLRFMSCIDHFSTFFLKTVVNKKN